MVLTINMITGKFSLQSETYELSESGGRNTVMLINYARGKCGILHHGYPRNS